MFTTETTTPTETAALAAIALATETKILPLEKIPVLVHPPTGSIQSLEQFLDRPVRQKTTAELRTVESFIAYANRFKQAGSTIYRNGLQFNLHVDHREPDQTVWSDHKAVLSIAYSEELTRWKQLDGKNLSQEDFAELLEERNIDIILPAAAEILEIVQDLHVTAKAAVTRSIRSNGKHHITYSQEQQAKGANSVELPAGFTIRIYPFRMQEVQIEVSALLRVRLRDSAPAFSFKFLRMDEEIEEAMNLITDQIAGATKLPVYI